MSSKLLLGAAAAALACSYAAQADAATAPSPWFAHVQARGGNQVVYGDITDKKDAALLVGSEQQFAQAFGKVGEGYIKAETSAFDHQFSDEFFGGPDMWAKSEASWNLEMTASATATGTANVFFENKVSAYDYLSLEDRAAQVDLAAFDSLEEGETAWAFRAISQARLVFTFTDLSDNSYQKLFIWNDVGSYIDVQRVDGAVSISSAESFAGASGAICNALTCTFFDLKGYDSSNNALFGNYSQQVSFVGGRKYGVSLELSCETTLFSQADAAGEMGSSCDAGRSAYWNGLTNLSAGDFALTSTETGTNYKFSSPLSPQQLVPVPGSAVPEPATWAMMLGGFGLLGAAARRRTRTTFAYA
jgi:hypothetical protein